MLWSQPLPSLPGDPPSTSLMTADHRSAFFFWGLHDLVIAETVQDHMLREYPMLGSEARGTRPRSPWKLPGLDFQKSTECSVDLLGGSAGQGESILKGLGATGERS